jgi:lysophospholipase L1-like esterase
MAGANDARQRKNIPKRANSAAKKAKRLRCWTAAQRRKAANIAAAKAAFEANEAYRRRGEPTPYEARRAAYYAGR